MFGIKKKVVTPTISNIKARKLTLPQTIKLLEEIGLVVSSVIEESKKFNEIEIKDLNTLNQYSRNGIASALGMPYLTQTLPSHFQNQYLRSKTNEDQLEQRGKEISNFIIQLKIFLNRPLENKTQVTQDQFIEESKKIEQITPHLNKLITQINLLIQNIRGHNKEVISEVNSEASLNVIYSSLTKLLEDNSKLILCVELRETLNKAILSAFRINISSNPGFLSRKKEPLDFINFYQLLSSTFFSNFPKEKENFVSGKFDLLIKLTSNLNSFVLSNFKSYEEAYYSRKDLPSLFSKELEINEIKKLENFGDTLNSLQKGRKTDNPPILTEQAKIQTSFDKNYEYSQRLDVIIKNLSNFAQENYNFIDSNTEKGKLIKLMAFINEFISKIPEDDVFSVYKNSLKVLNKSLEHLYGLDKQDPNYSSSVSTYNSALKEIINNRDDFLSKISSL